MRIEIRFKQHVWNGTSSCAADTFAWREADWVRPTDKWSGSVAYNLPAPPDDDMIFFSDSGWQTSILKYTDWRFKSTGEKHIWEPK